MKTAKTIKQFKADLKRVDVVYVWVSYWGSDDAGEYTAVSKRAVRKATNTDCSNQGADGGQHDDSVAPEYRIEEEKRFAGGTTTRTMFIG